MNLAELVMRRRNVRAFIKADPVNIIVSRSQGKEKTAAGGWVSKPNIDLPSQEARIVLNKRRYNPGVINSEAGQIVETDYLLIAEYTRDFKVDDTFVWLDNHYVIIGIHTNRQESILASINLMGPDNE